MSEGFAQGDILAVFDRRARLVGAVALLLWAIALALLLLVLQAVSYRVCDQTIFRLPPPTVHWPPEGRHLEFVTLQHDVTLAAIGLSIIAAFAGLISRPDVPVAARTRLFLVTIAASCGVGAMLWLAVQYHLVHAQLDALGSCL